MNCFYRLAASTGLLMSMYGLTYAQQTYFNVPSSDIVDKGKIAVQQQIDFADTYRSITTFDYGLGREWEVGLNLYHIEYEPNERRFIRNDSTLETPYSPLALINVQKAFDITDQLEIAIGAQTGFNLSAANSRWVGYLYGNLEGKTANEHYEWTVGAYTGHPRYLSEGSSAGFQVGFDAGIFYKKLHLLGDWISGSHQMGQLALGFEVFLTKNLPLAVGWQRANRDGSQSLVVQLTFTPE